MQPAPSACRSHANILWRLRLVLPRPQEQRPLDDPLVFGNYNVAYVSAGPKQYGQPVGGRFRGTFGKLLFRTTFLGQSVLQPNIVTNKVRRGWEGPDCGAVALSWPAAMRAAGQQGGRARLSSVPAERRGPPPRRPA